MGANKTVLLHGSDGRGYDWGMPRLRAKLSMRGRGLRREGQKGTWTGSAVVNARCEKRSHRRCCFTILFNLHVRCMSQSNPRPLRLGMPLLTIAVVDINARP